jgi:hypothetical protein
MYQANPKIAATQMAMTTMTFFTDIQPCERRFTSEVLNISAMIVCDGGHIGKVTHHDLATLGEAASVGSVSRFRQRIPAGPQPSECVELQTVALSSLDL